ncbi:MAG: MOSC domain-containing protein [Alphaproteobacteria bacterium]|jgi:uncharacterized protein YcbX
MRIRELWRYPVKSMLGESCETLAFDARGAKDDRIFAVRTAEGKFGSGKNTRRFRRTDGRYLDAALSDTCAQPVTLTREAEAPHFDAGAVHLITTSALAWLQNQLPNCTVEPSRFRPNLVVDDIGAALNDKDWIGGIIQISDAELEIVEATERCGMVAFPQGAYAFEPEIPRTITQDSNLNFGLYANLRAPGVLFVNDPVRRVKP